MDLTERELAERRDLSFMKWTFVVLNSVFLAAALVSVALGLQMLQMHSAMSSGHFLGASLLTGATITGLISAAGLAGVCAESWLLLVTFGAVQFMFLVEKALVIFLHLVEQGKLDINALKMLIIVLQVVLMMYAFAMAVDFRRRQENEAAGRSRDGYMITHMI